MTRRIPTSVALTSLCIGAALVGDTSAAEELEVAVRVAPSRAAAVDAVLARYAKPVQLAVPKGMSIGAFLRESCASASQEQASAAQTGQTASTNLFEAAPCAGARPDEKAVVRGGDTLEVIAKRMGLHASEATSLAVARAGTDLAQPVDPARIRPGDVVTADKAPVWTRVRIDASKVGDYAALLQRLAEELNCGSESPPTCLARLGVFVLDSQPARLPARNAASIDPDTEVPALPPLPLSTEVRVATGQWPYDADLVRRVLVEVADDLQLSPTVVGVADGGLASNDGRPLPAGVFSVNSHERPEGVQDADANGFVGDLIGAGVARGSDLADNGELEFCYPTSTAHYSTLEAELRDWADHGPIVASIATGFPLRGDAAVERLLPRIVFFRLNQGDCGQEGKLEVRELSVWKAVRYLNKRARIVNVSYSFDGDSGKMLAQSLLSSLGEQLLVVPAGNAPQDLDEQESCPPCIAHPEFEGSSGKLAQWIVVVGAATRALRRASYSGWGATSVRLFAPGDPSGALNVLGGPASASSEATSYAAPYAAFAAAIMHSLGIDHLPTLVRRMQLTTWPLFEPGGKRSSAGILDLAKAVAVRHWSIEVKEREGSATVLRTYVGHVPAEFAKFPICGPSRFDPDTYQAVRFGDPDAAGHRAVTAITRNIDGQFRLTRSELSACPALGSIHIDALRDGPKDLQLQDVTAVIAPL